MTSPPTTIEIADVQPPATTVFSKATARLAIINPLAGPQRDKRQMDELCRLLRHELDAEVVITRTADQVAHVFHQIDDPCHLAVFGGDGTIAEVVNHIDPRRHCLLALPGGSGNGFARDLGLTSVQRAIAAWRMNNQIVVDLLEAAWETAHTCERRVVISTASVGYAADTAILAKKLSRSLGPLRYTIASLMQAARLTPGRLIISVDDESPYETHLTDIMVNNTKYAGNFPIFRRASLRDGAADVLLANNRFWQQVLYNLGLLTHTYLYQRGVETSAKTLHIRSHDPLCLMLDGDIWDGVYEVRFTILPQMLRCFVWDEKLMP